MNHLLTRNTDSEVDKLAEDFIFSRSSLQTYNDCKRKFWLSYISSMEWPSSPASPIEEYERQMRLGALFHRLVQRAEEGVVSDPTAAYLEYPLSEWYRAYSDHRPDDLPTQYVYTEHRLETTIAVNGGTRRLLAKYDLLTSEPGRTVIIDWKTGRKATRPAILKHKMQTDVYPYVLVEASKRFFWGPVHPDQVEMRYWFVAAPNSPVSFHYNQAQHDLVGDTLQQEITQIVSSNERQDFPKVMDTERNRKYMCGFCPYRGYCDRGETATDISELDDIAMDDAFESESFLDFGLEDVEEIAY